MSNTEGILVLSLRLVRIPRMVPFFLRATSHLILLLNFLHALFILLPLPSSVCPHCFTFTKSSLITRPSPIFFHYPKQRQHPEQKSPWTSGFNLPALKFLPWVVFFWGFSTPLPSPYHSPPLTPAFLYYYLESFNLQTLFQIRVNVYNAYLCFSRKLIILFAKWKNSIKS